ncbi:MAG: helix-turn-helix transcriptional regulator [Massilibacteroides sp.]|nr:helix-turn-helix transcriptional regulator [Massilibacteroides sp.]MDD3064582.1 helix-turn-helix transcriptional regulator [Massilibacteroides sp.]MDD4661243.1 helix-turn-helix transcriptional regulator [Massilibacteroides sp.]
MRFTGRIRQLREECQMPQRQLAAALEIDTATYSKIEKGERRVKAEQIVIIADILKADKEELLALWLADQIPASVANESGIVDKAMKIVKNKSTK